MSDWFTTELKIKLTEEQKEDVARQYIKAFGEVEGKRAYHAFEIRLYSVNGPRYTTEDMKKPAEVLALDCTINPSMTEVHLGWY